MTGCCGDCGCRPSKIEVLVRRNELLNIHDVGGHLRDLRAGTFSFAWTAFPTRPFFGGGMVISKRSWRCLLLENCFVNQNNFSDNGISSYFAFSTKSTLDCVLS